jgi:hypothetical protein
MIYAALAAFLAAGPAPPQAVEPTTLTLACNGPMERGRGDSRCIRHRGRFQSFGPFEVGPDAPPR